jgi:hypothetical protein
MLVTEHHDVSLHENAEENMPPAAGRRQGSAGERRPGILWKLGAEIEIAASVWQQQMVTQQPRVSKIKTQSHIYPLVNKHRP